MIEAAQRIEVGRARLSGIARQVFGGFGTGSDKSPSARIAPTATRPMDRPYPPRRQNGYKKCRWAGHGRMPLIGPPAERSPHPFRPRSDTRTGEMPFGRRPVFAANPNLPITHLPRRNRSADQEDGLIPTPGIRTRGVARTSGDPIVRGGFVRVSPRVRLTRLPGLERPANPNPPVADGSGTERWSNPNVRVSRTFAPQPNPSPEERSNPSPPGVCVGRGRSKRPTGSSFKKFFFEKKIGGRVHACAA